MEKTIQNNITAHLLELVLMPALLYTYRDGGMLYWMVLILLDDAILKYQDLKGLFVLLRGDTKKAQARTLFVLECCMVVGIAIIAWKNWKVAGILIINDLILDFIGIFGHYNEKKK